ncbi:retrotransposon protein, putative, ty1-copia subclass [Tanacetum coccineum]|uniref:Retrotransposon protein, putative, ty1-copia subclass n=1 Tax=Tanacetum coccineum TaxID=301880 RepID=A0ABQ5G5Q9_9ASTR
MYFIEQRLPAAPAANSKAQVLLQRNVVYDAYNEVACLILAGVERFDLIQTFHACKQEEGKPVAAYVLQMKGYVDQLEHLGYMLPQDLIVVSKNIVFYFNVIPSNGIYEIDMHDLVPNVNSIYNVSTKRAKHNLDSTYLWHCRLGHISKKRIEKLQQEGLLKSTDDESFDQCVSCLSGKMTRKLFPRRPERATDLLGIIHTNVCGPLRHVSRQGASYFITFTDDYSRYGYVYLLKHKHELTPPYTPQHSGDYALESATRILNMVPTKKGCEALMKRDMPDKLQQRSVKCIFIGYPKETMGYYFYFPPENKIVVARYAEFFEKNLITQEVSGRAVDLEEIQDEDTSPSEITSEIPMEIDAVNAEIQSMMDNMVWVLVDLPPGYKTVGSKWIFKKKTDMDGIVHTYKARLVAKGYTQLYGVDYEETFSPIANIRAIRILISIAAYYDYEIWKMDVKTTFLNGYLDEDIYMVQPEGFVDPNHPRKVCKLQRSIYGLKQASRSWNKRFDKEIKSVKDYLGKCFAMKDLGEAAFILGIKFYKDRLDLNKTQGASTPKEVKRMQNVPYASTVRSIMYALNYIAAKEAEMEAIWIRKFISSLGIVPTINKLIKIFCDNSATLLIANEPGVQMGARHYHRSNLLKVHTDDNLAYPFTKALPKGKLTQHAKSMGLRLASSFM